MITLQQYFESINYRITEGGDYGWQCYGPNAHMLSSWNGVHGQGRWSTNVIFDTSNQTVYEVEVCDYTNDRAYRMINPDFKSEFDAESVGRCESVNQAWDDVDYIDLDVEEDFLEKLTAIVASKDYDTRVQIPVDFSDEELLRYMKLAHEQDMTFNAFVEQALRDVLERHRAESAMES